MYSWPWFGMAHLIGSCESKTIFSRKQSSHSELGALPGPAMQHSLKFSYCWILVPQHAIVYAIRRGACPYFSVHQVGDQKVRYTECSLDLGCFLWGWSPMAWGEAPVCVNIADAAESRPHVPQLQTRPPCYHPCSAHLPFS